MRRGAERDWLQWGGNAPAVSVKVGVASVGPREPGIRGLMARMRSLPPRRHGDEEATVGGDAGGSLGAHTNLLPAADATRDKAGLGQPLNRARRQGGRVLAEQIPRGRRSTARAGTGPAAPRSPSATPGVRRQDARPELLPLAGLLTDALVVDPRRPDRDRPPTRPFQACAPGRGRCGRPAACRRRRPPRRTTRRTARSTSTSSAAAIIRRAPSRARSSSVTVSCHAATLRPLRVAKADLESLVAGGGGPDVDPQLDRLAPTATSACHCLPLRPLRRRFLRGHWRAPRDRGLRRRDANGPGPSAGTRACSRARPARKGSPWPP